MASFKNDLSVFDGIHEILAHHNHPFILVGPRATRWMGSKVSLDPACDIVLRKQQLLSIVTHLTSHKDWKTADMSHEDPNMGYSFFHDPIFSEADALLERKVWTDDGVNARYLRIWSDKTLHLDLRPGCKLVEVPDIHARKPVLAEVEFCHYRYGTDGMIVDPDMSGVAMESSSILLNLPRHGRQHCDYKMYIPSVSEYWNALVAQKVQSEKKGLAKSASRQMSLLFRCLSQKLCDTLEDVER